LLLGARLRLTPPEVFAQGGSQPVVAPTIMRGILLWDGFRGGGHGGRIHDLTNALRTPEDKFAHLPDWPYEPHYERRYPQLPAAIEIAEGGHFVQEWGEPIAEAAVAAF
jgi:hypothetical protein